jgi:hypothetical protein
MEVRQIAQSLGMCEEGFKLVGSALRVAFEPGQIDS